MTEAIKKWVELNKHFFKSEEEKNHLIDFLKDKFSHKNSINFSYEQCVQKSEQWVFDLNMKNQNQTSSGLTETIMEFDQGYKIVKLLDQASKNWEGLHMRHCVASYKDHEGIYSLRDIYDFPHCTIEITNLNTINQIKGKANSVVHPKYINYVLSFLKKTNAKVYDYDMENLNCFPINSNKLLEKYFTGYEIKSFNNKKFAFIHNPIKPKKSLSSIPLKQKPSFPIYFSFDNQLTDLLLPILRLPFHLHWIIMNKVRNYSVYDLLPLIRRGWSIELSEHFLSSLENIEYCNNDFMFEKSWVNLFNQNEEKALALYKKVVIKKNRTDSLEILLPYLATSNKNNSVFEILGHISSYDEDFLDISRITKIANLKNLKLNKLLVQFLLENKSLKIHKTSQKQELSISSLISWCFLTEPKIPLNFELLDFILNTYPEFNIDELMTLNCGSRGDLNIVKTLVEKYGANIHYLKNKALMCAINSANWRFTDLGFESGIVQYLLDKGADLTDRNGYIYSSAMEHLPNLHEKWIELLTKKFNEQNSQIVSKFSSSNLSKEQLESEYIIIKKKSNN